MLAIIIINYNKYNKTVECIESIRATYSGHYIIYLLDNGSTNESREILQEKYEKATDVKLVLSEENLGYARGNNKCLEMAVNDGCDYALVANNDIVFKDGAIRCLYEKIQTTDYLAIGPRIYKPDGSIQNSVKVDKPSFTHYIWHETYMRNFLLNKSRGNKVPDCSTEVYWLVGCLFMFNLEKFKALGFFDPYTFLFYEEYIVSEKALESGLKLYYCTEAEVVHFHGASMGGALNMITRKANWRSESYVLQKYFHWNAVQRKIVWIIRCLEVAFNLRKEKEKKQRFLDYYRSGKKYLRKIDG